MNSILLWSHNKENKKSEEKKEQKITEEIVVTAEAPREALLSKVSIIKAVKIMEFHSKSLSDIMNYSTGVYVTQGSKNEARVQIRGLESRRITLLYDGIPVYEPYFNSFDLKSFSASEIESIKVIKGASSVLYGPNTLGGIINVITQRPEANSFSLDSQFSENSTNYLSGTGKWILNRFSFLGSVSYDKSNGFDWMDRGTKKLRNNSQYERMNFIGKMYYHPGPSSEILAEIFYLNSEYGIPWATEYYRKRFWRFNDWQRGQFNFFVNTREFIGFSFSFWGVAVSSSQALFKDYFLNIPGYFLVNMVFKKKFSRFSLYLKAENILNQDYFTEPGFPMKARTISLGMNISTESKKKNESS